MQNFLQVPPSKTRPKGWETAFQLLSLTLATVALTGCAQLRATFSENWEGEASEQFTGIDKHSAYPAVRREHFEQVNLIELLDPSGNAERHYPAAWSKAKNNNQFGRQYDLVLSEFRERISTMDPESAVRLRNGIQDRIISVSTSRCNVFKTYLRRQQSDTNFLLGSATTVAGVLGAILPGQTATRNLAGTAGIFSGIQAEFNSSYYSNLAAHVIVQGIELQQQRLLSQLMKDRSTRSISDYGMEAAIRDAVYFDGTCSTVAGLVEAAESIKEITSPGLPRAAEVIASVKAMSTIAQSPGIGSLAESGELDKLLKITAPKSSPLVVTSTHFTDATSEASRSAQSAYTASTRLAAFIEKLSGQIVSAFSAKQAALPPEDKLPNPDLGKDAAKAFAKSHEDLRDKIKLADCEAALSAPARELALAQGKRATTVEGSPSWISAQGEVYAAAAKLNAASALVEWQLKQAENHLIKSFTEWRKAITDTSVIRQAKKAPDDLGLTDISIDETPFRALPCAASGT